MDALQRLDSELAQIRADGLYKTERVIASPQAAEIVLEDGRRVLNFCANNYLGLANHPRLKEAARAAIDRWGAGPAAVRALAGTQALHLELEERLARFKGVESALFVGSGFVANLTVGPAFILVSTSGPLLQRWFSRSGHAQAHDPYFLYAASNARSLAGLLAYPALIEPMLTRQGQSAGWRWAYLALIALVAACAAALLRAARKANAEAPRAPVPHVAPAQGPRWGPRLRWVLLAAVPSSLMLGVTQHITTDLASIPLFWIVPLAIYLLTFVSAYSRRLRIPAAWTG